MATRCSNFTVEELDALVTYLEKIPALVSGELGKTVKNIQEQNNAWQDAANWINAVGLGKERTSKQVRKKWADMKCSVKKKAARNKHGLSGTGGGPCTYEELSGLEQRILNLIGKTCAEGVTGITCDLASTNNAAEKEGSTPFVPTFEYMNYSDNSLVDLDLDVNNDSTIQSTAMQEENGERSSYSKSNKENTPHGSWHLGSGNNSGSAGTRRKRESRARKRKIFDEDEAEQNVLRNQEEIKDCLLSLKIMEEKKLEQQEELLNIQRTIAKGQEEIINKLGTIIETQKTTNTILQALSGGVDVVEE